MPTRFKAQNTASLAAVCRLAITVIALALTIPGVSTSFDEETPLLAWVGCWQPVTELEEDSLRPLVDHLRVCIEQSEPSEDLMRTLIVNDHVVAEATPFGDGNRRRVQVGECEGWESSLPSADGRRFYLRSELSCENGEHRRFTGASMLASADRWIEIQTVRADREREVSVREYLAVSANTVRLPGEVPVSLLTARQAAAKALTADDVIEALQHVDSTVVEAMLKERGHGFPMNERLLMRLDDAGVPGEVIDLMLALSFPDHFTVVDDTIALKATRTIAYGGSPWSGCSPYAFGYGSCAPFYHNYYSHHYYNHHYYDHHLDRPAAGAPRPSGGAVVSGRGYTRVRRSSSGGVGSLGHGSGSHHSTGIGGFTAASSSSGSHSSKGSSGSSGSVSSSGYSRGR